MIWGKGPVQYGKEPSVLEIALLLAAARTDHLCKHEIIHIIQIHKYTDLKNI